VNNAHIKQLTEKKTQRFICIQQVLCRNTIRPWVSLKGSFWRSGVNETKEHMGISRPR